MDQGNWHKWVWIVVGIIATVVLLVLAIFLPGFKVDIHSHNMVLKVAPGLLTVEDQVTLRSQPLSPTMIVLLNDEFQVQSITQSGRKVPFMRVSSAVVIPSFAVRKDGQGTRTLTIKYSFVGHDISNQYYNDRTGGRLGEEAAFIHHEALWYPTAKGDKCTMQVSFDLPANWQAAFPGRHIDNSTFAADKPRISYAFACGPYQSRIESGPLKVYSLRQGGSYSQLQQALVDMLRYFQQTLDESYPFEALVAAEIPGVRHQLYSSGGLLLYDQGMAESDALFDTARIAAAVADNWWSQRIRTAGGEGAWLSMSIPRYLALDYVQTELGEQQAAWLRGMWASQYLELLSREKVVSLAKLKYQPNSDVYHSTLNYKGPLALSALQNTLGRNELITGLRAVIKRYQEGTTALTYRRLCLELNKFAGISTDALLSHWLQKEELPQLKFADVEQTTVGGEFIVTGEIVQSRPYFAVDIPVSLVTESGEIIDKMIELRGGKTGFRFSAAAPPRTLVIDRDNTILKVGRAHGPLTVNSFWQMAEQVTIVYPHDSAKDLATANALHKRAVNSGFEARVVADNELTSEEKQGYLVVVGLPAGFPYGGEDLFVNVSKSGVVYAGQNYPSSETGFAQILPNRLCPGKLVLHYYNLPTNFAPHGDAAVMLFDRQGVFLLDNPVSAVGEFSGLFSYELDGRS